MRHTMEGEWGFSGEPRLYPITCRVKARLLGSPRDATRPVPACDGGPPVSHSQPPTPQSGQADTLERLFKTGPPCASSVATSRPLKACVPGFTGHLPPQRGFEMVPPEELARIISGAPRNEAPTQSHLWD